MWLLHPPKSRRRWHVFTWLAALPALVFVALVQVAGVEDEDHELLETRPDTFASALIVDENPFLPPMEDPRPDYVVEYLHGWPTPWLRRGIGYRRFVDPKTCELAFQDLRTGAPREYWWRNDLKSWSIPSAWPYDAHASQIDVVGLVVNAAAALCLIVLTMAAVEFWLRRRGGLWRFKIVDFLAVVLLLAIGLGFFKWDKRQLALEQALASQAYVRTQQGVSKPQLWSDYVGPEWLARLFGNPDHVPVYHRLEHIEIHSCSSSEARLDRLCSFVHLRRVRLYLNESSDVGIIHELARFKRIRSIQLIADNRYDLSGYIAALKALPRLEVVMLEYTPLAEDLLELKVLTRLKKVTFNPELITEEERGHIERAFPEVSFECTEPPLFYRLQPEQIALARLNRKYQADCTLSFDGHTLRWNHAPFTAKNLEPLARVIPTLRVLEIKYPEWSPATLPDLSRFDDITNVMLWTSDLPVEFMDGVADLPKLVKVSIYQRPRTLEPLLALQRRPPRILFINRSDDFSDKELAALRDAFGERLETSGP